MKKTLHTIRVLTKMFIYFLKLINNSREIC